MIYIKICIYLQVLLYFVSACNLEESQLTAMADDLIQHLSAESPAKIQEIPHFEIPTKVQKTTLHGNQLDLTINENQQKPPVPNILSAVNFSTINADDLNQISAPIVKNNNLFANRVLASVTVSG